MYRVLTVCSANLVRSPVAEAAFRSQWARCLSTGLAVASAGLTATNGRRPPDELLAALPERLRSVADHRSRLITRDDVRSCDLVLVMTEAHRSAVQSMVAAAVPRIFTLREFARLLEPLPALSELEGDLSALVDAAHQERPRRPATEGFEDVDDVFGVPTERYRQLVEEIEALVTAVTGKVS